MSNKLSITGVSHHYLVKHSKLDVFTEISFDVDYGETVSLLGPSGCGKSTILKVISGLLEPVAGKISIWGLTPEQALSSRLIGFAFQDAALLDWKTVYGNIQLPYLLSEVSAKDERERIESVIALVGLEKYASYFPEQLSGGMKQRVALARSLVFEPRLLLLDEPFGALDLLTRIRLSLEIGNIINTKHQTTVLVSHGIEEAILMSSKIILLSELPARIVASFNVTEPYPRTFDFMQSSSFTSLVSECRRMLIGSVE